ncbi:TlpA disulfide reductase family protein [Ammoniphilus sp. CFH 90114]|uniref:TlpA family protein disulfide reductase n=1 Tax=Ammoniphilus sp. CFH 90114 TaxID=2493665 RepID=UPI00100EEB7B|nr:TlpA disulfide reductase family protein [Ammoniphilus sp. CFH 90114]RXT08002.1 TlpA family protein disulfide reductase [Ammoniphilus sp. CFH 90114]
MKPLVLIICLLLGGCSTAVSGSEAQLAPIFQLGSVEGEEISLENYKGKPVILNFWTTWCPPCKEEMPVLQRIHDQYKDQLSIVGVNLTYQDDRKEVRKFLEDHQITYDIGLDKLGEITKLYQVQALPTLFLIDGKGQIVRQYTGALSEQQLLEEIQALLK